MTAPRLLLDCMSVAIALTARAWGVTPQALPDSSSPSAPRCCVGWSADAARVLERVRAAAQDLPEPTRTIFRLNRFEGLSQQSIARQLGVSTTTVENHIRRALDALAAARDGRHPAALSGLSLGGGLRVVGKREVDLDNRFTIAGYETFDASIRYAFDDHWEASVNAENLADRFFVEAVQGDDNLYPATPRRVVGTLRARF
jgi:hypothetical protein